MRFLLALLAVAGCSKKVWVSYESGDESLPKVVSALRSPRGDAVLVNGDRAFLVGSDALRSEIRAFTRSVADAASTTNRRRPENPGAALDAGEAADVQQRGVTMVGPAEAHDEVFSVPPVTRQLSVGALSVMSVETAGGTLYRASIERKPNVHLFATVRGTPELDGAWERLVKAAEAKAGRMAQGIVLGHEDEPAVGLRGAVIPIPSDRDRPSAPE